MLMSVKPSFLTLLGIAFVIFVFLFVPEVKSAQSDTEIAGTISLHGCTAQPTDFILEAVADQSQNNVQRGVSRAQVQSVSGRQFTFVYKNLTPEKTYVLGLHFNGKCGRVFWRSTSGGIVEAGTTGVAIEGFAARTRIEVLGRPGPGRPVERWVAADAVDFPDRTASQRSLRVQTDLSNVRKFVLQFATSPFPVIGRVGVDSCMTDGPSVVRTVEYEIVNEGGPTELPPHGHLVTHLRTDSWYELPGLDFNALIYGTTEPLPFVPPGGSLPPIDSNQIKLLEAGAPLYIRAIPESYDSTGVLRRRCEVDEDGVSGWTLLAKASQIIDAYFKNLSGAGAGSPSLRLYSANYKPPTYEPYPSEDDAICVKTIKEHTLDKAKLSLLVGGNLGPNYKQNLDWDKWGERYINRTVYKAGQTLDRNITICVKKEGGGSSGWFSGIPVVDQVENLLTGLVDLGAFAVDSLAKLYSAAQDRVVDVTADILTDVGVPCNSACRAGLQVGLTIAMASAGFPPKFPSLDTLKGDLNKWAAAQIADQLGAPGTEPLFEKALAYGEHGVEEYINSEAGSSHDGLPDWLVPDLGFAPAILTLTLEHLQTSPPPPFELIESHTKLSVLTGRYLPVFLDVPRRFYLESFVVPNLRDTLKVPIALQPYLPPALSPAEQTCQVFNKPYSQSEFQACLSDYSFSTAVWNKNRFVESIKYNPCIPLVVTKAHAPTVSIQIQLGVFVEVEHGPWDSFSQLGYLSAPILFPESSFPPELPTPANQPAQQLCKVKDPNEIH